MFVVRLELLVFPAVGALAGPEGEEGVFVGLGFGDPGVEVGERLLEFGAELLDVHAFMGVDFMDGPFGQ